MTTLKKISLIGLFGIALPTFCMDVNPEIQVLDDGLPWQMFHDLNDAASLVKGKVVATRHVGENGSYPYYQIHNKYPTYYAISNGWNWAGCFAKIRQDNKRAAPTREDLKSYNCAVRLLSWDEARHLARAWANKEFSCNNEFLRASFPDKLSLDNLIPQERIKYFREQVSKNKWERERLFWIGNKKSPESPLRLLPRDVIRSALAKHIFHAEAYHLLDRAKFDDVLNL